MQAVRAIFAITIASALAVVTSQPARADVYPSLGWSSSTVLPGPRWGQAMAAYSSGAFPTNQVYLYVISGYDGSFANTAVLSRYDVSLDSWSTLAPMPTARGQIGAVTIAGRIYVPGGYAGSFAPVNTLSIYDIATGLWQSGAVLPQPTGDYAIGAYADRYIYVIGGYSGSGDLNNVQVYDTVADSWQSATAKPGNATAGLRGGIVGNHIIVAGGYSQSLASELADAYAGTIDSNDPTVITWAAVAPYPGGTVGRLGAGVPAASGPAQGSAGMSIVVFTAGDPDGQGVSVKNDTWIYDFNADAWRSGPPKPTGVSNISNLAGFSSNGAMRIASTGGYNGSIVVDVNEWLTLGYETPPDLALTIDDGGLIAGRGGTIVYTLSYSVGSPGTANGVTLTETVPAGTKFDAAASDAGWTCTPDETAGSTCSKTLGDLAASTLGSVAFAVGVISPVPDEVDDQAVIATGNAQFGPEQNLVNNTANIITPTRIFADGFEQ